MPCEKQEFPQAVCQKTVAHSSGVTQTFPERWRAQQYWGMNCSSPDQSLPFSASLEINCESTGQCYPSTCTDPSPFSHLWWTSIVQHALLSSISHCSPGS